MKIGLSAVDKIYCVCAFLQNVRTNFMGIKYLEFFQFICLGSLALLLYYTA